MPLLRVAKLGCLPKEDRYSILDLCCGSGITTHELQVLFRGQVCITVNAYESRYPNSFARALRSTWFVAISLLASWNTSTRKLREWGGRTL